MRLGGRGCTFAGAARLYCVDARACRQNSSWRRNPYNWQYCAGRLVTMVGVGATAFLHPLIDDAHRAGGNTCNGLCGWLAVVFVADVVLCVPAAVLGFWYTVRTYRS
jgi:hypothetical protein